MDIDLNGDEDDFEEEIPHESIYPNVTTPARNGISVISIWSKLMFVL